MIIGDQNFSIRDLKYGIGGSQVLGGKAADVGCGVSEAREVELVDCAAGGTVVYG
jgi:hypothetical protein